MDPKPFIDTNVLLYTVSDRDSRKERAAAVIATGGIVSVQILNEFVNVARGKLRKDWSAILQALENFAKLLEPPLPLTFDLHRSALDISRRYGFTIYDSLIVSAAKHAGCGMLYTEDLQYGQTIEGVLVRNPFADA
jgi:predicted nucleic acid-binding protein